MNYSFTFPELIQCELDYAHNLGPGDYKNIAIPDGRIIIEWYFKEMTGGVAYQEGIYSQRNLDNPNVLIRDNFANLINVNGRGWTYTGVAALVGRELPPLQQIPTTADLFETAKHDDIAVKLLRDLTNYPGIKVSNSSKLLHQKRPGLIPIFDTFVRRALNIPWVDEGAIELGFFQFRHVASYSSNAECLGNLAKWVKSNPAVTRFLAVTRVRIMDILAWGAIRQGF